MQTPSQKRVSALSEGGSEGWSPQHGEVVRGFEMVKTIAQTSKSRVWLCCWRRTDKAPFGLGCTGALPEWFALKQVAIKTVNSAKKAEHLRNERLCLESLRGVVPLQAGVHTL